MKIVHYPHPALRHAARPLTAIDKRVERYIAEMLDLMYEGKGLGLAGPQVALPYQIFVMNLEPEQRDKAKAYINPVIMERKGSVEGEEGCLSFPGLFRQGAPGENHPVSGLQPRKPAGRRNGVRPGGSCLAT